MISKLLDNNSNLYRLFSSINDNKKISVLNVGEGEIVGILGEINRPKLFVVASKQEGIEWLNKFNALNLKTTMCASIPNLFLNEISNDNNEYFNFLSNIFDESFDIFIVTIDVLLLSVPNNVANKDNFNIISVDMKLSPQECKAVLTGAGYSQVESISCAGEFSYRGETIDIALLNSGIGYRITFDYDIVEKIKKLDDNYLESISSYDNLIIPKNKLIDVDIIKIEKDLKNNQYLLDAYINYRELNIDYNNLWFWPYLKPQTTSILNVLPDGFVIIYNDAKLIYNTADEVLKNYEVKIKQGKVDNKLPKSYKNPLMIENLHCLTSRTQIAFHYINNTNRIFSPNLVFNFKSMPNVKYGENYNSLIIDLINNYKLGYTTILFCDENNYPILIKKLMGKCNYIQCKSLFSLERGVLNIINKEYNNSFNFYDEKICVIGSNCVGKQYNYDQINTVNLNISAINEIELPSENDYVVHKIHGIGKCLGIKTLQLSKDNKREYIIVEYKNEDKLYLPIENVDSITKYIGDNETPKLNKLGGAEFRKIKEKVKESVKEIAQDLIKIYKSRENVQGYRYPEDDEIQNAFESDFPHRLTYDQESTIQLIKKQMSEGKLIDRLICGDVGFGKTEVAIRIAFKTLLAGKTVAVLCPTTILSEQHFNTFSARMKQYGINVNVINRFKTTKETQQIIQNVKNGTINVIIGTHKLLNNEFKFNNLGLLIIDEEQKFGVLHKEKIKSLKQDVNVVTLSATPIPRTLHISLSGIRDISTIQTPPTTKQSTQVYVQEYTSTTIKYAIQKELDRGGQVLIIYNRVNNIDMVAKDIRALLGAEVVVDVCHGQMPANILEQKIINLYNGKTQVLIATTLVENGVDLPNANTIIVLDSDKLGLAQLYQLKGRVGRGSRDSYAFFMYEGGLSDIAYKRLKAINEFTAMGSGFKISMRDMELRGAGNIFGSEQHGHLTQIGYAMYLSILNTTIDELKNNIVSDKFNREIKIETDLLTSIPNNTKFTTNQKILLYTKMAQINSKENYDYVINQIKDIYGEVPDTIYNLCKLSFVKNMLYKYNAIKLIVKNNNCKIEFDKNINLDIIKPLISDKTEIMISPTNIAVVIKENYHYCTDYLIKLLDSSLKI